MQEQPIGTKTKIYKELYLDLYNRTILLFIGNTKDEVEGALKEHFGEHVDFDCTDCLGMVEKHRNNVIMYMKSPDRSVFNTGTLVHESVHVASEIFKICSITHDLENEEPYAYLVDWIARQVLEVFNEYSPER